MKICFCGAQLKMTYSKTVTHETVNDWIREARSHGQPMTRKIHYVKYCPVFWSLNRIKNLQELSKKYFSVRFDRLTSNNCFVCLQLKKQHKKDM